MSKTLKPKIGIVGLGFVGSAICQAFELSWSHIIIKDDPAKGFVAFEDDLRSCEGIFVCVPTPQGDDGVCNTSILERVLERLAGINYKGVIISKCTAPPDVYEKLGIVYPNLVHAPEFLTAANAEQDYLNGYFAIIGGNIKAYMMEAERLIRITQSQLKEVRHASIAEAALAKYTINTFLASKVAYFNELYQLCNATGCDYNTVRELFILDNRIGKSHTQVPGPDGHMGFGGYCFPKDTSALLAYSHKVGSPLTILDAVTKKNTLLRLTEPK